MLSPSLLLSLLLACGGTVESPVDGADPGEGTVEAPEEKPPEGFACPEGTTQKGGSVKELADHWHRPSLPHLKGEGPMSPPDEGFEDRGVVPEMDEFSRLHVCVREDGSLHGPYHATVMGGDGRVVGSFADGKPTGDWLGLWIIDDPDAAPPEATPEEPTEEPAEGEAPADEPEEAPEKKPATGAPEVPEGARLMFAGSYDEAGVQTGKWFEGCDLGCNIDLRVRGLYDEAGKMNGKWTYVGDQEVVSFFITAGELNGRFVSTYMDQTVRGAYLKGARKGKWITKKGDEVIATEDHGGQVRTGRGGNRGR